MEAVIIHSERKDVCLLQFQKHEPIKKVCVEMVRQVVESEKMKHENDR